MPGIDWNLIQNDPAGQQARGFSYADQIQQSAAARQAGQQFSQGDYNGAANTVAQSGDIDAAAKIQDYGVQHFQTQQAYLQRAVPVFQQILQQRGPQAVLSAYDSLAPDLKTIGVPDQQIAAYRQRLAQDPQGTLQSLGALAQHQFQYHTAGDTVFITDERGQLVGQYEGNRFVAVPQGGSLVETAPAGNVAAPTSSPAPTSQPSSVPAPAAPASPAPIGQPIIPQADPSAMHAVESGNNPNAVSSAGAVGVGQTLPSTLQSPGFGVAPAKDNSPQEQQRVADDYLGAMNQKYGNPVLAHIAYNMGPGNTDKWLASGGDFSKLPDETQKYLGRIAVAQAVPQGQQQSSTGPRVVADNRIPIDQNAIDNDVRLWIASKGTINPNYGMGTSGVAMRQAFDSAKNRIMGELGVTPEDVASGQAARKADTQSLTRIQTQADQIQAFEQTASQNADLALNLARQGGGASGQSPLVNKWTQEYRKWISGDKNVSAFTAALGTFADEYAKVVGGQNGSTDSLRAAAYDRINTAMNAGQLDKVVATMKQEMQNRTDANDFQLNTIKARLGDAKAQAALNGGVNKQQTGKVIDFNSLRK